MCYNIIKIRKGKILNTRKVNNMTVKELFMHFSIPTTKFRCDNAIQIYDRETTETIRTLFATTNVYEDKIKLPEIIDRYAERKVFEWCVKAEKKDCFSFIIIVE